MSPASPIAGSITRYAAIYIVAYVLMLPFAPLVPLFAPPAQMLLWSTAINYLPRIVLFAVVAHDMASLRHWDFVTLIATFFLGLAAPLLSLVNPKDNVKYLLILSFGALLGILGLWFSSLGVRTMQVFNLLINLSVMALVIRDFSSKTANAFDPQSLASDHWTQPTLLYLVFISLLFPACAVLLLCVARLSSLVADYKRYLLPVAIVAAMAFLIDVLILFLPEGSTLIVVTFIKSMLYLILCLTIGIMLLADRTFRAIPRRGWLYLTGFFLPYLAFPAAIHCLPGGISDASQKGSVEELPGEAVE